MRRTPYLLSVLSPALVAIVAVACPAQSPHWAYQPVQVRAVPATANPAWVRSPLDAWVLAAMEQNGLSPAPRTNRAAWLRRVTLDLTGVPPTPAEVAAFVADTDVDAEARAVDALLASPRCAERWTQWWLDLARYADSQGYEKDALRRTMWRYREWVIDAFLRDLPFDEFTIDQLAGDLLPGATDEQRLATAFHRQTMTNTEGGTDDEEFRCAAVIDRVSTTMGVWMGTTMGCAQCHDHKYDPFSQKEFFELFAIFDQTEDNDQPNDAPVLRVPSARQRATQKVLELELTALRSKWQADDAAVDRWAATARAGLLAFREARATSSVWHVLGPIAASDFHTAHATAFAPETEGVKLGADQQGLRWRDEPGYRDGKVHTWSGDNSAFYLHRTIHAEVAATAVLSLGSDDAIKVWWNGAEVLAKEVGRGAAADQELLSVALRPGDNELLLKITNGGGIGGFYFDLRASEFGREVAQALAMAPEACDDHARSLLRREYLARAPEFAELRTRITDAEKEFLANQGDPVPVLKELPPDKARTTRLHLRGSFLTPGMVVQPGTPACWPPMPADAPRNRLGFARWLVSRDNPLTARVQCNRVWAELFGAGLVTTSEDFGTQGEKPTHPELLDWLAADFMAHGWSFRHLLRTIVLSATYAQDSAASSAQREVDPQNRWLARGASFRLPAEMLRDQALAVSGLLHEQLGGPSVMPPQPDGVWMQLYSGEQWQNANGPDRYRRALYTFWRRTSPHPAMLVFDAQSREACVLKRQRTNTPLQALVVWNDPEFHEAALALAERVQSARDAGSNDVSSVRWLWQQCLLREPTVPERERVLELLREERRHFAADPAAVAAMVVGGREGAAELAAWAVVCGVVLNLDEFLTKR
ncbi:MAG: DUF1553 domain-containing protein [Planctomycetes bacterium]|nr:DUF1553 domain-containing protein [Planctomycetota bacterium]